MHLSILVRIKVSMATVRSMRCERYRGCYIMELHSPSVVCWWPQDLLQSAAPLQPTEIESLGAKALKPSILN